MYFVYQSRRRGSATHYSRVTKGSNVSLFGRNEGWIPWILSKCLPSLDNQSEPLLWHLSETDIRREIMQDEDKPTGNALIIDLKPNDARNLSLYEIEEAWGHSAKRWTPVMLRLKRLFCDENAANFDRRDFTLTDANIRSEPIFSFYYARGTVLDGKLEGTWNLTAPGSANSALLWPDTMTYFCQNATAAINAWRSQSAEA